MASTRYRIYYMDRPLKERGIRFTIREYQGITGAARFGKLGDFLGLTRNLFHATNSDIMLLQKVRLSSFHLNRLLQVNKNIVFDLDDAVYTSPPWRENDNTADRRRHVNRILKHVPYVIVGNPVLGEYVSQFCEKILVAPTALPRDRYEPYHNTQSVNNGTFTVGWIGNEENLWYLKQVETELNEFLTKQEDAEMRIITAADPPKKPLADRTGDDVYYVEWNEEQELDLIDQFDVGIRPLTDDEWTRAKGGFTSVIQCMAMGIPVVVSPVGMLSDIVEHGKSGYHTTDIDDWVTYLRYLVENPEERRQMGNRALKRVGEKRFWNDQRADELASFYRSIVK